METGGQSGRWLTLTGVPGCGKTFVASQLFRLGAKANPGGKGIWIGSRPRPASVWLSASEFGQRMKSGDWFLPESLANEWLVAIDDLGAEHDKSGFLADALYRACNARLGKWTIFTTNFTLGEIADRLDQRIASRLIRDGNEVFSIDAGDYAGR